jgi:hypothetical protein
MTNLFSDALKVLAKLDAGDEVTEKEMQVYNLALVPLGYLYDDVPIREGLREMSDMLEPPPESVDCKFWRVKGLEDTFPLLDDLRYDGRIARLVKHPSRQHFCRECHEVIGTGEPHYTATWGGAGLRNIKFPSRLHVVCLPRHLGITMSPVYLMQLWDVLFDYAYHHCEELHRSGRMYGYVTCMQRVWKEAHDGSKARATRGTEPGSHSQVTEHGGEGDTSQHL